MMKKIWVMLLVILSVSMLFGCQKDEQIVLPDLSGMNKTQALAVLQDYKLVISIQDVTNNDVNEGIFVSYSNDLYAQDTVDAYTSVVVYFAVHANVLPDLSGKTQSEVISALSKLNVVIDIQLYQTNDFPDGTFLNYGEGLKVGDILDDGADVLVYIAKAIPIVDHHLLISKYTEGLTTTKAIELYNSSDETMDLSAYQIDIYSDGSDTVSISFGLSGMLESGQTYVIANSASDPDMLAKADLITQDLSFNGNDAITLVDANDQIVDIVGTIGWGLHYLNDRTLVRAENITLSMDTFDIENWNEYMADCIDIFGSHPVTYPTTFTYDSAFLSIPFTEPGGMIKVEYVSIYDGDTAYFTPGFTGENRVRFIGVDATEMGSGTLAIQARDYMASLLSNASEIYLQYDPASGNVDTYGRTLALIWADGVLVNYMLILHGYSQNNYQDDTHALIFNHIYLSRWMTNAEKYAKENHLGVWA